MFSSFLLPKISNQPLLSNISLTSNQGIIKLGFIIPILIVPIISKNISVNKSIVEGKTNQKC